jgi:hypothetical protein
MKCDIISFVVAVNPMAANSETRTCFQCNTHHWPDVPPTFGPQLCPIGKIEQAVEDGLAKIAAALEGEGHGP